ncbi:hypothetical protein C0J52_09385, partial [Blattella germanica]
KKTRSNHRNWGNFFGNDDSSERKEIAALFVIAVLMPGGRKNHMEVAVRCSSAVVSEELRLR